MKSRTHGFSLIEVMMVVAIIGILSMTAIPSYRGYVVKAKSAEIINYMTPYKNNVSEYVLINSKMPTPEQIGLKKLNNPIPSIRRLKFRLSDNEHFIIEARPSTEYYSKIGNKQALVLEASFVNNRVTWRCGTYNRKNRQMEEWMLPASCQEIVAYKGGS